MSEWQDIESAPKDGTPVFLWWDGDFAPIARWENNRWMFAMAQSWPSGFPEQITHAFLGHPPTHWMPLPEPPA